MSDQLLQLDFVSPLPPVRSGIADYSADLLPHLAERCDLRLIHLPGQPVVYIQHSNLVDEGETVLTDAELTELRYGGRPAAVVRAARRSGC